MQNPLKYINKIQNSMTITVKGDKMFAFNHLELETLL